MEDTQYSVKPLTVYKASAGSGKTFTLASEYIKLLIDNPKAYENILAVTFTNKATEEMKSRILSQLYGIAHGLHDSNDYLRKVCEELNIDEETARRQAGIALQLLLHNYNFFRVQTIDTFFQGVLRNLAKELSLGNNLRISLNDKQVISQAVDNLMDTLTEDSQLMSWVEEYVNDSMDEEKTWNISGDVKAFGENLTKEFFKNNRHSLAEVFSNPHFFSQYKKELNALIYPIEQKYRNIGQKFYQLLAQAGLTVNDFSRGAGGAVGYFVKLAQGLFCGSGKSSIKGATVISTFENGGSFATKTAKNRDEVNSFGDTYLRPLYAEAESTRDRDYYMYNSALKTLANINRLRLLHSIEQEILHENGEHSRFMLSDTQTLLNGMIADDERVAPFIFEKIGTRIKHIMIDEFQDTSRVQWSNFRVLLDECMANPEYEETEERVVTNNLIVGDVKQSIYRFRSGDWRLLNNIDVDYGEERLFATSLSTNYRSERNVITFNNRFFTLAAKKEAERIAPEGCTDVEKNAWAQELKKAYSDVEQKVPEWCDNSGYVNVQLFQKKEEDTNELMLNYIHECIKTLVANNAQLSDIAILVRSKTSIPVIADYMSKCAPDIKLVSEEAFRLDSSPAVRTIIAGMRLVANPNDTEAKGELTKGSMKSEHLPSELTEPGSRRQLTAMPLVALAECLFRIFRLDEIEGQTIYVSTFFDKLSSFVVDNGGVLEEFLTMWEDELHEKTVSVGNIDGIRIMSIHKSKGLEFDHVIIPFCNWTLLPPKNRSVTLWCNVDQSPFSQLPFIPVEYKNESTLQDSIYERYGNDEYMQEVVDNLNLLYVGFTRAGRSLFVTGDYAVNKAGELNVNMRATLIRDVLKDMAEGNDAVTITEGDATTPFEFTLGSLSVKEKKDKKTKNVFLVKPENVDVKSVSYSNKAVQFRQSNNSRDFADDITDDDDSKRFIHNGTLLHQLFSSINTIDDVERVLQEMEFEGILYNEDTTPEMLRQQLMDKFRDPQIAEWFAPHWQVFNECAILTLDKDGKTVDVRPDRVITDGQHTIVIDYKFGAPHEGYEDQVRNYVEQLQLMGMPDVHGYLWYVSRNRTQKVV